MSKTEVFRYWAYSRDGRFRWSFAYKSDAIAWKSDAPGRFVTDTREWKRV